jgi:quercetin dioxygenase-like cupin family protein
MAIPHASSGQVVDLHAPRQDARDGSTTALIKTDRLEVIRMVLPAGKEIPPHRARGEITVQCLEGRIAFDAHGRTQELAAGQLLYLDGGEQHALKALEPSTVLLTIRLSA